MQETAAGMCLSNNPLLIVASSGRMLASSAVRAGFNPLVIDLFADCDTRQISSKCFLVNSLSVANLTPILEALIVEYPDCGVVYGSGLEAYPESLALLAQYFSVFGNHLNSFEMVLNKRYFFECLEHLNIPFPEISFSQTVPRPGLVKPCAGEGGEGIYHCQSNSVLPGKGFYWQQYVLGNPLSVLFLANGNNIQLIGFNRQWTVAEQFLFSGVINQAGLPPKEVKQVLKWLTQMVLCFNLKGLNSLDFIWDGQQCWILELNPRPSASLALYDTDYSLGLVQAHINACCGQMLSSTSDTSLVRAYQIIYALNTLSIARPIQWPDWVYDRPQTGMVIKSKQPICSILVNATAIEQAYLELSRKQQILFNYFEEHKHVI